MDHSARAGITGNFISLGKEVKLWNKIDPQDKMLFYIEKIISVPDYSVLCLFNTGEVRKVNLEAIIEKYSRINDGLVSQLADQNYFNSVRLDSYGTLHWDNDVDFDPDNLYKMSEPENATI